MAQEVELPDPGLAPDSPFYFLELIAEEIVTFFTFGDVKKAERHAALAIERMTEAQAMMIKGEPELVEKALERCEKHLAKASSKIESAAAKGENTAEVAQTVAEITREHTTGSEAVEMMAAGRAELEKLGIETFEDLAAFCLEQGGPPEVCSTIEAKCREFGATTVEGCMFMGSTVRVKVAPEMDTPPQLQE